MKAIILPVLPGQTEAWRRFLQELRGSRAQQFNDWCTQWAIEAPSFSLDERANQVIIQFVCGAVGPINLEPENSQISFLRWLHKQTMIVHGFDLFDYLAQACRENMTSSQHAAGERSAENQNLFCKSQFVGI